MRVDGALVHPLIDFSRCVDREVSDLIVGALLRRMRQALIEGHPLQATGIGEISVRQARPYALVHPGNGQALALGGERTLHFRPDRGLVRDLNLAGGQGHDSHAYK